MIVRCFKDESPNTNFRRVKLSLFCWDQDSILTKMNKTYISILIPLSLPFNTLLSMLAKVEEDAIVIDDSDMLPESINSVRDTHKSPGNTYFDIQLAIEKEDNNYEDPEAVINRRLTKFFEYGKKIEPGREYFCPRKQPDYSQNIEPIGNELIIYGCDFKKLKVVKKQYDTVQAIRINESNFKLIYPDYASAWKAINKNAKDPSSLVRKMESEDAPLPKTWFQMQPYSVHNRMVQVYARFAMENERDLQPKQEALLEIYRQCGEIYNQQERKKREEQMSTQKMKREKLDIRKQNNSQRLYQGYEKGADREWKIGKNNNPGAHREHSRSRSRSNDKNKNRANQMQEEGNDNASNYSFILSKSKKDINELNAALGDIHIKDKSVKGDLSIIMGPENGQEAYDWSGKVASEQQSGYRWDYRAYMRQKEEEEELARRGRHMQAVVITIDDDN